MSKISLKRNAPVAELYEDAVRNEGAIISATGALINFSGKKTGRSPKDKRIVYEETSKDHIWWGPVNIKMDEHTFEINRERAIDYLNTRDLVYVFDGFAGVSPLDIVLIVFGFDLFLSGTRNIALKCALFALVPTMPFS